MSAVVSQFDTATKLNIMHSGQSLSVETFVGIRNSLHFQSSSDTLVRRPQSETAREIAADTCGRRRRANDVKLRNELI